MIPKKIPKALTNKHVCILWSRKCEYSKKSYYKTNADKRLMKIKDHNSSIEQDKAL